MKLFTTLSGVFAVLAVAAGTYFLFQNNDTRSIILESENFNVSVEYTKDDIWEYNVQGTLPTPCHSVDLLTDSSNVEQGKVSLLLYINPPLPDILCTQDIQSLDKSGTFSSPENSKFELSVVRNNVIEENPDSDLNDGIPQYDFASAETIESDGYTLTYIKDRTEDTWGYTVTGTLPTPCYSAEATSIVQESFPETVVITLQISEPDPDEVCIQQIQDLKLTGEVQASESANFSFQVARN